MYIEKIQKLMEKAPLESQDLVEYATELTRYVNMVAMHELHQTRQRVLLDSGHIEQQDYVARMNTLNEQRNMRHDRACRACQNINIMAARHGMQKIFDFEPQIMGTHPNGVVAYSQDNHYKVSEFCGQFINEFYEKGTLAQENVMDKVAEIGKKEPYKVLSKEDMEQSISEWNNSDKTLEAEKLLLNKDKGILRLRDNVVIEIEKANKYGEFDISIFGTTSVGTAQMYFDKVNIGTLKGVEIPKNVVMEIIEQHGGVIEVKKDEKSHLQDFMNGKLNGAKEQGVSMENDMER